MTGSLWSGVLRNFGEKQPLLKRQADAEIAVFKGKGPADISQSPEGSPLGGAKDQDFHLVLRSQCFCHNQARSSFGEIEELGNEVLA
jgi:hypothetical protein